MAPVPDLESFAKLARALEPWIGQVVIIGGWAHRLYRLHPKAQELDYAPLMTIDTDVAVPANLEAPAQTIRERLLASGFTEEFFGDDRPPATHYRLGQEPGGFYAEFLTPLAGSEYDRRNRRKATIDIGGITSQQLRYIDLLLRHPWKVDVNANDFMARVCIANPASFLVQKLLIHRRRDRDDRAKDILYMHDTLEVFGSRLAELRHEWQQRVSPHLQPQIVTRLRQASRQMCCAVTDDIRRAARIPSDRRLSPEDIMEACRFGFDEMLR